MITAERIARFMSKVAGDPNSGCWLWLGSVNNGGYGNFWHDGKCLRAHRFSHLAFIGQIPRDFDVMHKCDTPACVNPSHLKAASTLENVRDAWAKGRMNDRRGENNGRSKITNFGRSYIRDMALIGYASTHIAEKFQISTSQVRRIARSF